MNKKAITVLALALFALVLSAWLSAPIYPEYVRRVESFEEQKRHLSRSDFVLLDFDESHEVEYDILLSARTRLAKPVGYIVSWTESIDGTPCLCFLMCREQEEITGDRADTYQSIPIFDISGGKVGVILNNHSYVLSWNSKSDTDIEDSKQLADVARKVMIAYAKKIIDASTKKK